MNEAPRKELSLFDSTCLIVGIILGAGIYQVAPDDFTGCGLCVDICPAKNKRSARLKAINMAELAPIRFHGSDPGGSHERREPIAHTDPASPGRG